MSKIPLIGLGIIFILILATYLWWSSVISAVNSKDTTQKPFLITRGETLQGIAADLEKQGLIKSSLIFRVFVQVQGKQKDIKAGNYRFSPSMQMLQIVSLLVTGPKELWVTFPEGLRREELIDKTVNGLGMDQITAQKFAQEFLAASKGLEGQLFPDTYLFSPDVTAVAVVTKLKSTFDTKVTGQMRAGTKKNGLTFNESLVLASIIERETNTREERPIVSGILLKRLDAGWPLQTDATLQYIVASKKCTGKTFQFNCNWWTPPTVQDKELKSPFNTYLNKGLPPTPIANPSLSAFKAAIYPQASDYWFYLHDKDGKIHYAKTDIEHQQNIQKYL